MASPTRLAIVVSHPIQHFVSFYRALAADPDIDLHVLFGAPVGVKPYFDVEMNAQIAWNMDMLGGYSHEFLDTTEGIDVQFRTINSPLVAKRLAAARPDAILVYGYAQANALRAIWWGWRNKVPVLIISDSEQLQRRAGWKSRVKDLLIPRIYARVAAFLSVGDQNEAYYRRYGAPANRIFRSPFTIDEESFRAAAASRSELRAGLRAEIGATEDECLLLFVGKLSERKRPQDLLEGVQRLNARGGPRYRAVFAGNGNLLEPLKDQAAAQGIAATFLGFVNVDRLPAAYAAADLLVHPSQADPHPLICSEAACIGLPMVLSSHVGAAGPTDIARPGDNARIFACGDAQALADAVVSIVEVPGELARMQERSRAIFEELDIGRSVQGVKDALHVVV